MFILSENQFKDLLVAGGFVPSNFENESMIDVLDIGAGDGEVTSRLAKAVIHMGNNVMLKVYATEYSWTMRDRLQKKKFTYIYHLHIMLMKRFHYQLCIFRVIDKIQSVSNIHLISCLNVLDRCADPHQIMKDIYNALSPDGRAVVALVLPYSHYVESSKFVTSLVERRNYLPVFFCPQILRIYHLNPFCRIGRNEVFHLKMKQQYFSNNLN